jgi:hypothetical protein
MSALLALCWWLSTRRPSPPPTTPAPAGRVPASAFMLLGVCAATPLAISPRLSGHYFLPAVPMFALAFAMLAARRAGARVRPVLVAMVVLAAVVMAARRAPRAEALMRDLGALEHAMPREVTIGACPNPRSSDIWQLHSYVQRRYRVSLDARARPVNGWFLRSETACAVPPSCQQAATSDSLTLFRCVP